MQEGHGGPCAMGEQGSAPSGVYGTLEEDGPDSPHCTRARVRPKARDDRSRGRWG